MRPKLGISACLLGERVRWDGGDKHAGGLLASIAGAVEWIPVCPEVGAGLATPREPMHLERRAEVLRLVGNHGGADLTAPLAAFAQRELARLAALPIAGYVLKSRSPSCALTDAAIPNEPAGAGLFARALAAALPGLPITDELALLAPEAVRAFLAAVRGRS